MSLRENIIKIWKSKGQILEGVTNSIFKREDVEQIAKHRMEICLFCDLYTENDKVLRLLHDFLSRLFSVYCFL